MAIKKITINKDDLPDINFDVDGYLVRYRIVSDNKNKVSHWSQIYSVSPNLYYVPNRINIDLQTSYIVVLWDPVKVNSIPNLDYDNDTGLLRTEKNYDIWIRWSKNGLGDWIYFTRLRDNSISILKQNFYYYNNEKINDIPDEFSIEVRQVGYPISREYSNIFYAPPLENI